MAFRTACLIFVFALFAIGQEKIDFVCPMDKDVHQPQPGKCPRCGMKLVAGLPDPVEYPVNLRITPKIPQPGQPLDLRFTILDPSNFKPVTHFEVIHEKLFHLFLISRDLQFFSHVHPEPQPDGSFELSATLPKTGQYRVLSDFFPSGGTPQIIAKTIIVPGPDSLPKLTKDLQPKDSVNLKVSLRTEPEVPIAGTKTMLFFELSPGDGLEPYLGARGHMLAASEDLIDMIHTHPAFDQEGPTVQFNVIFPRKGIYRVWVQFQRLGKVNTVQFDLPVDDLH